MCNFTAIVHRFSGVEKGKDKDDIHTGPSELRPERLDHSRLLQSVQSGWKISHSIRKEMEKRKKKRYRHLSNKTPQR